MHAAAISYLLRNNELLTEDQLMNQLAGRSSAASCIETEGSRLLYLLVLMRLDITEDPPPNATEHVIGLFARRKQRVAQKAVRSSSDIASSVLRLRSGADVRIDTDT
ncbi:MAG: hypothetical protein M1434_01145 [Chloroflexi bacterium]|nr:hypothetical protein [Chloroflexota bacterium]MCL5273337.1 hypothetical protein [Chloroflexota bacterium]